MTRPCAPAVLCAGSVRAAAGDGVPGRAARGCGGAKDPGVGCARAGPQRARLAHQAAQRRCAALCGKGEQLLKAPYGMHAGHIPSVPLALL